MKPQRSPRVHDFLRVITRGYVVWILLLAIVSLIFALIFLSVVSVFSTTMHMAKSVTLLSKSYIVYATRVTSVGSSNIPELLDPKLIDKYLFNISKGKIHALYERSLIPPRAVSELKRIPGISKIYRFYTLGIRFTRSHIHGYTFYLLCGEGDPSIASVILGPVRLIRGHWPQSPGEIVVSRNLLNMARGLFGKDNSSSLLLRIALAKEGNPLIPGKRVRVVTIPLRIVGVYVAPYEMGRGIMAYTECKYLLPVLREKLGRYLEPWGYNISSQSLWVPYAVIYLSNPGSIDKIVKEIKQTLSRYNVTEYDLYYDKPWLKSLSAVLSSLRQSYELIVAISAISFLLVPILTWLLLMKRSARSLLLFEFLGLEPKEIILTQWLFFVLGFGSAALAGLGLSITNSRLLAYKLVPGWLVKLAGKSTISKAILSTYSVLIIIEFLVAYMGLRELIRRLRLAEILRSER